MPDSMTSWTKNLKITDIIVRAIFIFVVHFKNFNSFVPLTVVATVVLSLKSNVTIIRVSCSVVYWLNFGQTADSL